MSDFIQRMSQKNKTAQYKLKCINCKNQIISNAIYIDDSYGYGCSLVKCNKCGQTFVDSRIHEIAINGVRPSDIPNDVIGKERTKKIIIGAAIALVSIILSIVIYAMGYVSWWLIIGIAIGVYMSGKAAFRSPVKDLSVFETERLASLARCQNPAYVRFLESRGYDVHTRYRNPADFNPDTVKTFLQGRNQTQAGNYQSNPVQNYVQNNTYAPQPQQPVQQESTTQFYRQSPAQSYQSARKCSLCGYPAEGNEANCKICGTAL